MLNCHAHPNVRFTTERHFELSKEIKDVASCKVGDKLYLIEFGVESLFLH